MENEPKTRYHADDRELLLGLYKKLLFQPAFALLPRWVPPNLISVFGVFCAVCGVIAAWAATHGAPIFFLVCAGLFYVYLIADNIDGSQARRLGQANQLGELIDHGLDGISSGCLLVAAGIMLHMAPISFFALAALGAMGYMTVIWEQYRTGKLIIPLMSCTEGVTLVAGTALIAFFANQPAWMRFDTVTFNGATGLLVFGLCCYIAAIFPPLIRVKRAGQPIAPMLTPFIGICLFGLYLVAGSGGMLPAIAVSMFAARISARLIINRQDGVEAPPMVPSDWLVFAPLIPAFLLPHVGNANIWAGFAAIIASYQCQHLLVTNVARVRREIRVGQEI